MKNVTIKKIWSFRILNIDDKLAIIMDPDWKNCTSDFWIPLDLTVHYPKRHNSAEFSQNKFEEDLLEYEKIDKSWISFHSFVLNKRKWVPNEKTEIDEKLKWGSLKYNIINLAFVPKNIETIKLFTNTACKRFNLNSWLLTTIIRIWKWKNHVAMYDLIMEKYLFYITGHLDEKLILCDKWDLSLLLGLLLSMHNTIRHYFTSDDIKDYFFEKYRRVKIETLEKLSYFDYIEKEFKDFYMDESRFWKESPTPNSIKTRILKSEAHKEAVKTMKSLFVDLEECISKVPKHLNSSFNTIASSIKANPKDILDRKYHAVWNNHLDIFYETEQYKKHAWIMLCHRHQRFLVPDNN